MLVRVACNRLRSRVLRSALRLDQRHKGVLEWREADAIASPFPVEGRLLPRSNHTRVHDRRVAADDRRCETHDRRVADATEDLMAPMIFLHGPVSRDIPTGGADGPRFNCMELKTNETEDRGL